MSQDRADQFLRILRRSQRGRLKIYLGYCAGVGKTYQMLEEGHQLLKEGFDVVVGLVETHGRPETARLVEGLEVIPRRSIEYRGIKVEEMDCDAIIARKPTIVLIDEIAHTNVPGSRNPKRYQDVQDILAAGIHVVSTLNVQHIESLYDTVQHITGVKVRERIPDTAVSQADQIVNVDLTTEDLIKRLKEGKIYPKDRIKTASDNFFTETNLENLRELTLRELASQIDIKQREPVEDEIIPAPDQIMVCLSSRGPDSEKLLRYASRFAGRLNRNWYAVYVQAPHEEPTVIDARIQRILSDTLTLAKQLGAIVFTYKGKDIPGTILQFAKEYRVGHIVIGTPLRIPWFKRIVGHQNILDQLVRKADGISIVVLDTKRHEPMSAGWELWSRVRGKQRVVPERKRDTLFLGDMLAEGRIVIWNTPVQKDEVLSILTQKACAAAGIGDCKKVQDIIMKREEQGSTFFNEGAAFPHARLSDISSAIIALGIAQWGVEGVSVDKPVELIFLILTPAHIPDLQVKALSAASGTARNNYLVDLLRTAETPREVIDIIKKWESFE
jgi:two-component system, OmpR family, sensor histidine kinase KdpD